MSAPVRVVFVVPDLAAGGAERHLVDLVGALDPTRVTASVVCLGAEGALFGEVAAGVPATALHRSKRAAPRALVELVFRLRRARPDAVVVRGYSAETLGRLAALLAGVPAVLVWVHNSRDITPRGRVRRWLDRVLVPRTTAVVGFVEAQRPYLTQLGWRPDQVRLVPPGVLPRPARRAPAAVRAELGIGPTDEVVTVVAGFRPEKDHATLVRAFRSVVDRRPRARLLAVGEGPCRGGIEKLAAELGLTDRVVFAGRRTDVPDLLGATDVVALGSRTECAPVAVLEAMAAGLPVVATAVGGVPELVADGVTGHLVAPGDDTALAGRLAELLGSPERRRALGAGARARVDAHFRHDAAVRVAEDVLVAASARVAGPVRLDVVVDLVDRGGAEIQLLTLARSLDPSVVRPRLVCLRRAGELAEDFRAAGCEVVVLDRRGRSDPRTLPRLVALARGADVVLVANHQRAALTLGRLAALVARVPSVVAVHDMGLRGGRSLPRHVVATLALSRALVVLAPRQIAHLRREGVGARPWSRTAEHVIPNGVVPATSSATGVRAELGLAESDVVVGMVARLAPEKAHETALAALARLVPDRPGVRLVIVGGGARAAELRAVTDALGLSGHVVFTGPRPDVPRLLTAFDLFCLSSRDEAVPLAVLEAMTAGLPVVTTDCGALRDVVTDGREGFVVPVGDDAALADRIATLVDDPDRRAAQGAAARRRADREFGADVLARRYEALLVTTAGRRRHRQSR